MKHYLSGQKKSKLSEVRRPFFQSMNANGFGDNMRIPDANLHPPKESVSDISYQELGDVQQKKGEINYEQSGSGSLVYDVLHSAGNPIDENSRSFMESHFGYDFSNVKIHTDAVAAKSAQSINALAYTSGNSIVFNDGQYVPSTESGRKLLAHELTHVVQQNSHSSNNSEIQRKSIREEVPHLDSEKDGIYLGSVDRYEYKDKKEYNDRIVKKRENAFYRGNAKARFDSNNCVFEVPLSVKFINNDTQGQTHCHSAADKPRPLPKSDFERTAQKIMSLVPQSLNNWYNIHLGNPKTTGCNASNIPIKIILTREETNADFEIILTENKGRSGVQFLGSSGSSELSGGRMILCGSEGLENDTIIHESAHMVLATGDEYDEPGKEKSRERYGEHSRMAQDGSARLLRFYERHFQFASAFMNSIFPDCDASLVGGSKENKNEITPDLSFGVLSTNQGNTAGFLSLGLSLGIPLTKMRSLTLNLGPQLGLIAGLNNREANQSNILALLGGVRAGLKYRNRIGTLSGGALKVVAGASGEAGGLWNFADNPGGLPAKKFTPYVEGTGSLGVEIDTQFYAVVEAGMGKMIPGGSHSDIDYYKFGLRLGVSF